MSDNNNLRGLREVRIAKDSLLESLRINQKAHVEAYETAVDNFFLAWKDLLLSKLQEIQLQSVELEDVQSWLNLDKPRSHEDDYTRAIRMVELSLDDEFLLSESEFNSYVLDDWAWKKDFVAMSKTYEGIRR